MKTHGRGLYLVWRTPRGEERKAPIKPPMYIGRLPPELGERLLGPSYNPYHIYIYYEAEDRAVDTGLEWYTVSRFHAKIDYTGVVITIADHGSNGRGSLNGTYVGGRKIAPGVPEPLLPGTTVKLGSEGPSFRVEGEQVITLTRTVPEILPEGIAEQLRKAGIEMEVYNVPFQEKSGKVVVVPRQAPSPETVVKIPGEDKRVRVVVKEPMAKPRRISGEAEVLHAMRAVVHEVLHLFTVDKKRGREAVYRLFIEIYREVVEKTDPLLKEQYEVLRKAVERQLGEEIIVSTLKRISEILDELLRVRVHRT